MPATPLNPNLIKNSSLKWKKSKWWGCIRAQNAFREEDPKHLYPAARQALRLVRQSLLVSSTSVRLPLCTYMKTELISPKAAFRDSCTELQHQWATRSTAMLWSADALIKIPYKPLSFKCITFFFFFNIIKLPSSAAPTIFLVPFVIYYPG